MRAVLRALSRVGSGGLAVTEKMNKCCDWSACTSGRYGSWRFCKPHLKEQRKIMFEDGYLTPRPRNVSHRSGNQMEDTRMTKYGYDG